jgi:nitrogen fixation/metabolism regulation signal transduction histidine kinase
MTTNSAVNQILGLPVFTHLNQLNVIDKPLPDIFRSIEPGNATSLKIANEREEKQISIQASKITMKKGVMKIVTLSNIGNELEAKEMESWIRLIRVMTHEIMNSIAPITSLTETLLFSYKAKQNASNDESVQNTIEALDTINTTAKGLITFVESYRKFTGIPKPQLQDIDLIPLLEKTVLLSSYEIKDKEIEIEIRPHAPSYMLKADEAQITQILVNLIKNGIEAIHKDKKGTIVIKTTETDNRINIDVSNNGEPIADDIAPHIFIPFFTTKESGNGIGLSVSRYIMRLHGGNLKHHTKDGWTVFSMSF